jgi:hypothetical protein
MDKPPVLKPTLPPLVIAIVDSSLLIAGARMPEWLLGAILGGALVWLLLASLWARGNIVRRWSWTREWFPFLDPKGFFAVEAELRSTYLSKLHVRIYDLAENNKVVGRVIEDCHIYGPGVVLLTDSVLTDSGIEGNRESSLIRLADEQKTMIGPIELKDCVFRRCLFHGIGFVGSKDVLDRMSSATRAQ